MVMVNPERGEVEFKIKDKQYVICAEMARVAAWMSAVEITELFELQQRLATADISVVWNGLKFLCISGDVDVLENDLHFTDWPAVVPKLAEALNHGFQEGNQEAAGT